MNIRVTERDPFDFQKPNAAAPISPSIGCTAAELQGHQFQPIKWSARGLLPQGLGLLVAKPKDNKTWLMLEISRAVAMGDLACGQWECLSGDVLFLALEDNYRRLKSRLEKLMPQGREWPATLTFRTEAKPLGDGLREQLHDWAKEAEHPQLVVIDTLNFVRPAREKTSYNTDYADTSAIARIAEELGVAIVCIHHMRKAAADDLLDTLSGTTGLAAGADTILTLSRDPSGGFNLYGRGRDMAEIEMAMEFDRDTCRWSCIGDPATARLSETRRKILDVLDTGVFTPTEVAKETGLDLENVKKTLQRMNGAGECKKTSRGKYAGTEWSA